LQCIESKINSSLSNLTNLLFGIKPKIHIKDDYVKIHEIQDLKAFKNNIERHHSHNGKGDGSLHEENRYWLRVTGDFYNYVISP